MAWGAAPGGLGLGRRPVGLAGGGPPDRPVRPLLVVGEPEGVELGLQLGEVRGGRLAPSQRLRVWWKRSILPWVWGWPGVPFFWRMPEVGEQVFEAVAAAGEAGRVDRPVVGERGGGPAVGVAGGHERGHHVVAGDPGEGRGRRAGSGSGRRAS